MSRAAGRASRVDGGYGWAVVFGSFLTHFLLLGFTRSFSILYVALLRIFDESATKTASLIACFNTVRMLLAPLVGALCKRTSCRVSMVAGGVVMMLGLVASAFATSLDFLYVTYGLVAGAGGALLFTPPYIIIGQYFDKRKGLAMSLGTVGAGLGSAVMAPVIVLLLRYYGYFGCMILLGGLSLHHCISGALFRPFTEKENDAMNNELTVTSANSSNTDIALDKAKINYSTITDNKLPKVYLSEQKNHSEECTGHNDRMILETTSDDKNTDQNEPGSNSCCDTVTQQLKNCINGAIKSLSLFGDVTMVLYSLVIFMLPVAMGMVIFFIADAAVLIGASDPEAAFIMTSFGCCDVIGRLGFGFIFDLKPFRHRRRMLFAILGILVGLSVATTGLLSSYRAYLGVACVFGVLAGGFHAQRVTVVSEFIPRHRLPDVVGVSIFCQGLGNLVGSPLAGLVKDKMGNYDVAYYVGGLALSFVSTLFLLDYVIKKCPLCRTKAQENQGNGA